MSALHIYKLVCNRDGCGSTFCSDRARADETRRDAATVGWTHRISLSPQGGPSRAIDVCPNHPEESDPTDPQLTLGGSDAPQP